MGWFEDSWQATRWTRSINDLAEKRFSWVSNRTGFTLKSHG